MHIAETNGMVKEVHEYTPDIIHKKRRTGISTMEIRTYSDASFNIVFGREYAQTGIITGLMIVSNSGERAFHVLDWSSCKQRSVSHSSYGAETVACANAEAG